MATGENLFSMQDARNLIRYGGMRPTATGCSSTARCATAWSSTCARSTMLTQHGWSPRAAFRTAATRCRSNIAAGLGLGGNESYPDLFQPYGGFPTACGRRRPRRPAAAAGHRLRGQGRPLRRDARAAA
jgi:hypothetical protein